MNTTLKWISSFTLAASAVVASSAGCGSDSATTKDPAVACTDLCKASGFTSSRVDVQPNEVNCFCTGMGTVADAPCKDMCTSIGKPTGAPFGSGAGGAKNACQCE